MNFIEIGEVKIKDKFYTDEICEALKQGGFKTALIFDGMSERSLRILKEQEE